MYHPPLKAPIILRHLHLPGVTSFRQAEQLQQNLVQKFLAHKALVSSLSPSEPHPPPPHPTIITFTPTPVYTLGRREGGTLTEEQKEKLVQPFYCYQPPPGQEKPAFAEIVETQRGGQTTFHGPGQLVIYPILDLKPKIPYPKWQKGLSVRCYVNLLEEATITTLEHFRLRGFRTENPGVWIEDRQGEEAKKIAALGVHLRRNITSYGVGLNTNTDLGWFDRIVACGLVGKGVTSMRVASENLGIWDNMKSRGVRRRKKRKKVKSTNKTPVENELMVNKAKAWDELWRDDENRDTGVEETVASKARAWDRLFSEDRGQEKEEVELSDEETTTKKTEAWDESREEDIGQRLEEEEVEQDQHDEADSKDSEDSIPILMGAKIRRQWVRAFANGLSMAYGDVQVVKASVWDIEGQTRLAMDLERNWRANVING